MSQEQAPIQPEMPIGVIMDNAGRSHFEDGKFMSSEWSDQINDHQDQIRDGLDGFKTVDEKIAADEAAQKAAQKETALLALADLDEQGATLDMKTLRDAGIGQKTRENVGYFGPLDSMLKDAKALKAARNEEQRIADYHADANAKADQWKAEKDAMRENRQAADNAIAGSIYNQRLKSGGAFMSKTLPTVEKRYEANAIAAAAEAGLDVSHRQPRHYEVATDAAGEQRAQEISQLLKGQRPRADKEYAKSVYAPAKEAAPVKPVIIGDKVTMQELREQGRLKKRTADMDDAARTAFWDGFNATLPAKNETSDDTASQDLLAEFLKTNDDTVEITADGASRNRFGVRKALDWLQTKAIRAQNAFGEAVTGAASSKNFETVTTQKKVAAYGAVLGIVALYALSRDQAALSLATGGNGGSGGGTGNFMDIFGWGKHDSASAKNTQIADLLGANSGHNHSGTQLNDVATSGSQGAFEHGQAPDSVTLQAGDSDWKVAAEALHGHGSNAQIDRVTDEMLKLNNITSEQAAHLPIGAQQRMPVELIEEINKANKS